MLCKILDEYLSLKDNDVFYLSPPYKKPGEPGKLWYTTTPMGQNGLNFHSMVKEMCKKTEFNLTTLLEHMGPQRCFKLKYQKNYYNNINHRRLYTAMNALRCPSLLMFLMLWKMVLLPQYQ